MFAVCRKRDAWSLYCLVQGGKRSSRPGLVLYLPRVDPTTQFKYDQILLAFQNTNHLQFSMKTLIKTVIKDKGLNTFLKEILVDLLKSLCNILILTLATASKIPVYHKL